MENTDQILSNDALELSNKFIGAIREYIAKSDHEFSFGVICTSMSAAIARCLQIHPNENKEEMIKYISDMVARFVVSLKDEEEND